ncbi:AraC family transcriptional regulator [Bremerella cremea]|uniref:AraC family transcriptional regulator n=1 Tax=Bremerella cremea TaxID=1031537 RepID=UPI0031E70387
MHDLVKFLKLRRSLNSHIDSCKIFRASPGWFRDRVLGIDYRVDPDTPWEYSEILLSEAFHDGGRRDYFFVSLLEDSDGSGHMEADFGAGKFLREARPGNMIFGDEESVQRLQGKGPFHSSMIYIKKDVVHEYFQEASQGADLSPERMLSQSFRDNALRVLMKQLIYHFRQPAETGQRMVKEHLQDLILQRLTQLAGRPADIVSDTDRLRDQAIRAVIDYMHTHFIEDLSLDQLAILAGVSRSQFVRLFRQTTGQSPKQYLMGLRVEQARQLLSVANGRQSVLDIAQSCGFCDQSHLAREFRQVYGTTPAVYRRDQGKWFS